VNRYWKNASGYYDPTLAKVIEKENSIERDYKKARKKQTKRQRPRTHRTDKIKRHKDQ